MEASADDPAPRLADQASTKAVKATQLGAFANYRCEYLRASLRRTPPSRWQPRQMRTEGLAPNFAQSMLPSEKVTDRLGSILYRGSSNLLKPLSCVKPV